MLRFIITLVFCSSFTLVFSQIERAQQLRKNVVAISAQGETGFGFITGERYDKLFVVTAAHVVEGVMDSDKMVDLKFFEDFNKYKGKVYGLYDGDVALIVADKPEYFSWEKDCLGEANARDKVAFVGREDKWYIPTSSALGTINRFQGHEIEVDINGVYPGSSGAPLITDQGIVGMIRDADGTRAYAINLNQLRSALSEYSYFFAIGNEPAVSFITDRDKNKYPTKVMKDGKRWMTKNLNVKMDDSWCYNDDASNCEKYGRLYTQRAAVLGCRELGTGWRLPKVEDWQEMAKQYGGVKNDSGDEGTAANSALYGNGSSGFSAQPGGFRDHIVREFKGLLFTSTYWSSTTYKNPNTFKTSYHYCDFSTDNNGMYTSSSRFYFIGRSVRCIQDN